MNSIQPTAATDIIGTSTGIALGTDYTVMIFVYGVAQSSDIWQSCIFLPITRPTDLDALELQCLLDGTIYVEIERKTGGTYVIDVVSTNPISAGWHAITLRASGTTLDGIVDSVIVATGTAAKNSGTATSFRVGDWDSFPPAVACCKIWTRALSDAEVTAEEAQYDPVSTTSLWGVYHLNGATDLADYSGNSHNMSVISGSPSTFASAPAITPPAAGSTTYTQGLSGGITPAGTLGLLAKHIVGGAVAPTGTLGLLVKKVVSGSITPVGVVSFNLAGTGVYSGSIAPAGTLSEIAVGINSLVGNITPLGTVTKTPQKYLGGAIVPAGSLKKRVLKALSGGITPAATVGSSTIGAGGTTFFNTLSGSIPLSGTLTKVVHKYLAGSVGPSGLVSPHQRSVQQLTLSGSITPFGVVSAKIIVPAAPEQFLIIRAAQLTSQGLFRDKFPMSFNDNDTYGWYLEDANGLALLVSYTATFPIQVPSVPVEWLGATLWLVKLVDSTGTVTLPNTLTTPQYTSVDTPITVSFG